MRKRGTVVLLVSVALLLFVLLAHFFGPNRRSSSAGSLVLFALYFAYAKQKQGPMIAKHLAAGGTLHTWWRVAGVSVLTLLALLATGIFGIGVAAPFGFSIPE
jgi:hypothetical protein